MIVKILGVLDILSGVIFWISSMFNLPFTPLILLATFYLLAKGVGFLVAFRDKISIFDIIAGLIIFSSLSFNIPFFVVVIVSIYLLQKGIFSLI